MFDGWRPFGPKCREKTPAPAGDCFYCREPVQPSDNGWTDQSSRPIHIECAIRMTMGSAAHQQRRCGCFGFGRMGPCEDESLSVRENAILAYREFMTSRTAQPEPPIPIVRKAEGVCGGDARVRNTRIPIWLLVQMMQGGQNDGEILAGYPGLYLDDLDAARQYYAAHPDEIDQAIRENEEA